MPYIYNEKQYQYSRKANPIAIYIAGSRVDIINREKNEKVYFVNFSSDVSPFVMNCTVNSLIELWTEKHQECDRLVILIEDEKLNINVQMDINLIEWKKSDVVKSSELIATHILNEYWRIVYNKANETDK